MVTDEVRTTDTPEEAAQPEAAAPERVPEAVASEPQTPVPASLPESEPVIAPPAEPAPVVAAAESEVEIPPSEEPLEEESSHVAAPEQAPPEQKPSNKHWYVVKVQSGREESIREAIERKVRIEGLEEYFGQIFIPTEKVTEMRNGRRYTRTRKTLPGYIMAEVEYNDRILYLFRETSGVGDFVGGSINKPPPPMPAHEVTKWLKSPSEQEGKGTEGKVAIKHDFEKGDRVRVKDGMFKEMEGEVKDILEEKNQVKVELTIFGRPVLVDLEYWQVERI